MPTTCASELQGDVGCSLQHTELFEQEQLLSRDLCRYENFVLVPYVINIPWYLDKYLHKRHINQPVATNQGRSIRRLKILCL